MYQIVSNELLDEYKIELNVDNILVVAAALKLKTRSQKVEVVQKTSTI